MLEGITKQPISQFFLDIIDTRGGSLTAYEKKIIVSMLKKLELELKELREDITALQEDKNNV